MSNEPSTSQRALGRQVREGCLRTSSCSLPEEGGTGDTAAGAYHLWRGVAGVGLATLLPLGASPFAEPGH